MASGIVTNVNVLSWHKGLILTFMIHKQKNAYLTLIFDLVTLTLGQLQYLININPMYNFDQDPIIRSWFLGKNTWCWWTYTHTYIHTYIQRRVLIELRSSSSLTQLKWRNRNKNTEALIIYSVIFFSFHYYGFLFVN